MIQEFDEVEDAEKNRGCERNELADKSENGIAPKSTRARVLVECLLGMMPQVSFNPYPNFSLRSENV